MPCEKKDMYKSLEWCTGKTILPGIRKRLYYIPKHQIVLFPVLPDTPAQESGSISEIVTYKGSFTLVADAKFRYIEVLVDESPVTSEAQGERPSVTSLNKATFKHPGTEEEATAFCKLANNDDFVYLVQQKNGKFRTLGNEMFETVTKCKQELGGAVTDKAGTTIEVEVTDVCPAPFYTGDIVCEAGTIDASTGTIKASGES